MFGGIEHLGQVAQLDIIDRLRDSYRHILQDGNSASTIEKNELQILSQFVCNLTTGHIQVMRRREHVR